jgi:hypothetical protein
VGDPLPGYMCWVIEAQALNSELCIQDDFFVCELFVMMI